MFRQAIVCVVACAAAHGWMAASADAVIVQFQAESGALGSEMGTVANVDALGGTTITRTANTGGTGLVVNYTVNFPAAGTYDLYARVFTNNSASADSFFVGADFGVQDTNVNNAADWHNLNGWTPWNGAFNGITTVDGQVWQQGANQIPIPAPIWVNLTENFNENLLTPGANPNVTTYTVAAPGNQTFQVAGRELGMELDAFAFALSTDDVRLGLDGNLFLFTGPNTDFDGMGGTDLADFHILRSNYLDMGALQTEGDANADFVVNHEDFFLWRTDFLAGGGSLADINWSPVPEPTTALLLLTGAVAMVSARRARRQS